jgi:signal transduction histidine kinase
VAAGFVAAFVCLVVTVLVTFTFEAARDRQAQLMARALNTLVALHDLEVATQGMATATDAAVQGTHAWELLLESYGPGRVEDGLRNLERLVAEEPQLQERLALIQSPLREMIVAADGARRALKDGRREEAARLTGVLDPPRPLQVIALMEALERQEEAVLAVRESSWRSAALTGVVVFAGATLALLVLMVAAARTVRVEIRERERLADALQAQLGLQQQLMAIVSHDLRNPLASMKIGAELLSRSSNLSDQVREDASRILSNARRMERLIRDLLDFTRLHGGVALPLVRVEAELVELTRRAVSDLGRDAEGRVTVEGRGDVGGVWDPDRLEQVVSNLVSNALKYGPPLRPVRMVIDGRGVDVALAVTDEGGSLTPAEQESLFQPFRPGRSADGEVRHSVGLGLYVVRRIAEAHGGQVTVDSAIGRGTTFTVRLPRGRAPRAAPPGAGG